MLLSDILQLLELPTPHRAGADVPHFPALHKIVQRLHRFFRRNVGVVSVDLEQVDVGGVETSERGVDGVENG